MAKSDGQVKIVKSRKDRVCSEHSYHTIRKGEWYLLMAMSPWHEMNQSKKWWRITACLRCAKEYGMHTLETQKQVDALK